MKKYLEIDFFFPRNLLYESPILAKLNIWSCNYEKYIILISSFYSIYILVPPLNFFFFLNYRKMFKLYILIVHTLISGLV